MKHHRRCLLLLVDGSRSDVFRELCEGGELPHCDRFFRQGGRFSDAVSVFPSTTGPAYLPFLTGCYPGTCDVPGIRWFDKKAYGLGSPRSKRYRRYVGFESFLMNRDLKSDKRTLFQFFQHPVNIFSPINRGTTSRANKTTHSRIWYWYYAHLTDRWSMVDEAAATKLLKALEEETDFAFVVFPAVDEFSHLAYPRHEKTIEAYLKVDAAVGRIVQKLKDKGWLEETLVVLVSDHGLSATQMHFGVGSVWEERGIRTFYYPKIMKWDFEAASMVSGNGMIHLYFKDPREPASRGWVGRTPFELLEEDRGELLEALLDQPAVDILAGQSADGSIVAMSRRGRAKIQSRDGFLHYEVKGGDPFGYGPLPPSMSDREALQWTSASEYPDALVQLTQIFRRSEE